MRSSPRGWRRTRQRRAGRRAARCPAPPGRAASTTPPPAPRGCQTQRTRRGRPSRRRAPRPGRTAPGLQRRASTLARLPCKTLGFAEAEQRQKRFAQTHARPKPLLQDAPTKPTILLLSVLSTFSATQSGFTPPCTPPIWLGQPQCMNEAYSCYLWGAGMSGAARRRPHMRGCGCAPGPAPASPPPAGSRPVGP